MTSPSDEYVGRLLRALERLPDERAARIVDEAWARAEASVRETLTTAMRAALLRRAVSLLEDSRTELRRSPAPSYGRDRRGPAPGEDSAVQDEDATVNGGRPADEDQDAETIRPRAEDTGTTGELARYVYGITASGEATVPADLPGVDPRFSVEVVSRNGLDAITSTVTVAEFGPDALRERLSDRGWLEEKVRIHEHVVRFGLDADALVPMRFCTIVRSAEGLAGFLEEHGDMLRRTLAQLAGRREWGLTVSTLPERFEEHVRAASAELRQLDERAAAGGAGTAYFTEKRRRQLLEDEGERIASAAAGTWHERLAGVAAAAVVLPPRRHGDRGDRSGHLILNGAYLVDRAAEKAFSRLAGEIADEARATGLEVALTGPWPPYSFVDDDVGAEAAG